MWRSTGERIKTCLYRVCRRRHDKAIRTNCAFSRRLRRPATALLPWDQKKRKKCLFVLKRGLLMSVPFFVFFFSHCRSQPQNSDVCTARTINKDSLHIHALGVQCSACHSLFYFFFLLLVFRKSVNAAVTRQHTQTPSVLVLASPSKPDPPFSDFTSPSSGLSLNSSNKAGLRSSLDHAKTERTSSGTSRGSRLRRYAA